ncbi:hypothetical protein KGY63_00690 [Candidatus Bipolaricaulota bacterium]|nr:hypothetical protein [Candidatus Bipolaricaulota bacterium]MBS3792782.1 hypothetical protein [Candidatus Bipolaricaulota bacterium]MBS3813885.1 hypothetical protein [Candidatus Bipolaricaulota bacterium]
MNREAPSIWEVLSGNMRMLFGAILLLLALILAFSAVYNKTGTFSQEGSVDPEETVGIEKRRPENEGKLNLKVDNETVSTSAEAALLDDNRELVQKVSLSGDGSNTVEIDEEVSYFKLVSGEDSYDYEYRIQFSYQPFRWLAIPAAIFTVFGVIAIYRGFDEFMTDFAEEKVEKTKEEGVETEEGQHVDFMGINNEEGEDR